MASQARRTRVEGGEGYVLLEGSMNLASFCILKTAPGFANLSKVVKFSVDNRNI